MYAQCVIFYSHVVHGVEKTVLVLINLNDITLMTGSNMTLFTDDTTLYIEFHNPDEATKIIKLLMKI